MRDRNAGSRAVPRSFTTYLVLAVAANLALVPVAFAAKPQVRFETAWAKKQNKAQAKEHSPYRIGGIACFKNGRGHVCDVAMVEGKTLAFCDVLRLDSRGFLVQYETVACPTPDTGPKA